MNENNESIVLDNEQFFSNDSGNIEVLEEPVANEVGEETVSDPADAEPEANALEGSETFSSYSFENPLPVVIVEEEEYGVELYAMGDTYAGTISDTYLQYFEGIVEKLGFNENYVIWRSGQYSYNMAWGESLEYEAGQFRGEAVNVCNLYRDANGSYNSEWFTDFYTDSIDVGVTSLFVYSNLGNYPTLKRGLSYGEELAFALTLAILSVFIIGSRIVDCVHRCYRR